MFDLDPSCAGETLGIAVGITVLTIILIYVFSWEIPRNSVTGVKLRLFAMSTSAVGASLVLQMTGYITTHQLTPRIELTLKFFLELVAIPFGITIIFFTGPIIDRARHRTLFTAPIHYRFQEKYRSYVLGPIIEEYLYRFVLCSLLIHCYSAEFTVFITATLFSISHAHHYMASVRNGSCDWAELGLHTLLTFLFGLYTGILYMRIKSITILSIIHAFCNWMSIPRYSRLWSKFYISFFTLFGFTVGMGCLYFFTNDYTQYRALIA